MRKTREAVLDLISQVHFIEMSLEILFFMMFISSMLNLSLSADTLTPAQSISDCEILVSSLQRYELGFFSPGNSENRYLGIWYKVSPDAVVWVANRNDPIHDRSGVLKIREDGNLILLNQTKSIIWSSNITEVAENPVTLLLDSGNLVIRNSFSLNSDNYLWQSFDYPTDTLPAGMKLGWDSKSGLHRFLTSWRSSDDPSIGDFALKSDVTRVLPQQVIQRGSKITARSGPWNGPYFSATPFVSLAVITPKLVFDNNNAYFSYTTVNETLVTRLVIIQSGTMQRLVWNDQTASWAILYSMPFDICDVYGTCGVNGVCSARKAPICDCLTGFVPRSQSDWEMLNWAGGCVRTMPLDCQKSKGFVTLEVDKYPDLLTCELKKNLSLAECEVECLKNCSCTAYANLNMSEGGTGCLVWSGDLIDIRSATTGFSGLVLYIRTENSDIKPSLIPSTRSRYKLAITLSTITGAVFLCIIFCCIVRRNRLQRSVGHESTEEIELPMFGMASISAATRNFSPANITGAGGFGPVYKGSFSTGQEIAVKRLSKNSGQGAEQFMNEVHVIAKLQHRNLVALFGCCVLGEERILVYEYLQNKSLDNFIFDEERSRLLAWRTRFSIVLGIARGLLYLHQDSKLQIIHRDLKVSNILLDRNLNPKISDFGLARIFGDEDKEAKTKRVVGTYGYMSPEYAIDGTFSVKSDVFSFGVLLLEIVCGKRNRGFCHPDHHHSLLGHAWLLWNDGKALELMDTALEDSYVKYQVLRCIQVGLLCVQKFPEDRPAMSYVVLNLANEEAVLPQPKQPGFFIERSSIADAEPKPPEFCTESSETITVLEAR